MGFLHITLLILIFSQFEKSYSQTNGPSVTVTTPRGTVVGFHFDQGNDTTQLWYGQADLFLGIPFAVPPVGELRYKKPVPITKYPTSPYNATYYRQVCIQPRAALNTISEDCLYLSIFSPNASSTTKYPVMIWIHGGGLMTGSGDLGWQTTVRNLVSKGIVVASLRYRMSWLGFMTTFTEEFPPNLGMLDQVLALKFLKEEISYFGGDPNQITIFGQSAGGHSVSSHTYSPLSQNLFQQVIMESGTVLTCYEDSIGPTRSSYLMAKVACNYTDEMWNSGNFGPLKDCLMKIDVADGIDFSQNAWGPGNHVCWNMVQDNYFLPHHPQYLWKFRPNIPAIIGTCKDEDAFNEIGNVIKDPNLTEYTRQKMEQKLAKTLWPWFVTNGTNLTDAMIKIYEDNYLPSGTKDDDHLTWLQFFVDVLTPAFFTKGSLRDIEYYLLNKNPNVYTYEWVWSSILNNRGNPLPNWHPAPHVCEIPYLFGYGNTANWTKTDQDLANSIQEKWANFAKYGKPTLDGSWTPTTSMNFTALEYFQFNNISSMKTGYRYKDEIVYNQLIPPVLGDSPPNLPDNYPVCPKGYMSKVKNTTCYEAFGSPLSWNDAQTSCRTNSYGTLVTVGSAFENSDLLAYAQKVYPSCTGFYIGLFQSDSIANTWLWTNYDTSTYRNWKNGYPMSDPTALCVVLNANDGTWTNQPCDNTQCYVCSY